MRHLSGSARLELVTVRFGNVLGSSGSVVPRFVEQIRAGGPITVTHPDVRRFFIRTSEAVQLVIEAAALGGSGAMYVLDMGAPIRIVDLARSVLEACGAPPDMPIEFIGLRPGEKLDEELVGIDEVTQPTALRHIAEIRSRKPVPETFAEDLMRLEALAFVGTADELIAQLRVIVPEFSAAAAVQTNA
jgi:FlaA1/EpsC-like NDP-sugar epimerase